jgi:phosphoribosylaminoimidazole carboxylase (NCAIR synthetase)
MKCHIEKATGTSPINKVILPGVPAGTKAAAKEMASRIQSQTEVLGAVDVDMFLPRVK